jgi:hypothetical protein
MRSPVRAGAALSAQRLVRLDDATALADARRLLGGVGYQALPGDVPAAVGLVPMPALSPNAGEIDAWLVDGPVRTGESPPVRWVTDGDWLFGAYDSTADEARDDLDALVNQAYRAIFASLESAGVPHLVRLWNYLPGINQEQSGLERYRQFNLGRQQAFLNARRDAFAGAPAACALGTVDGPLRIRFLAGRVAPVPLENPRQVPAWRYPTEFGPRSPTFSRAVVLPCAPGRIALLVSGTASIVGSASVHPGDVPRQVEETLRNLNAVIGSAHERCSARFALGDMTCTVYVRHAADADLVRHCFEAAVGADSPAARRAIYVQADICRSDLLLEIEAHATADGALA